MNGLLDVMTWWNLKIELIHCVCSCVCASKCMWMWMSMWTCSEGVRWQNTVSLSQSTDGTFFSQSRAETQLIKDRVHLQPDHHWPTFTSPLESLTTALLTYLHGWCCIAHVHPSFERGLVSLFYICPLTSKHIKQGQAVHVHLKCEAAFKLHELSRKKICTWSDWLFN